MVEVAKKKLVQFGSEYSERRRNGGVQREEAEGFRFHFRQEVELGFWRRRWRVFVFAN